MMFCNVRDIHIDRPCTSMYKHMHNAYALLTFADTHWCSFALSVFDGYAICSVHICFAYTFLLQCVRIRLTDTERVELFVCTSQIRLCSVALNQTTRTRTHTLVSRKLLGFANMQL